MQQTAHKRPRYDQSEIKDARELFILTQFAQLKTCREVAELHNVKFPNLKKVSPEGMKYYKQSRAAIIEQMRDKFIDKAMNIPIANERVRLQRTDDLYNVAVGIINKNDKRVLGAVDVSLRCLKEAREEVKGEGGSVQNFLQLNQYNELTDEQLLEKKKELENKFIELSKKGDIYVKA